MNLISLSIRPHARALAALLAVALGAPAFPAQAPPAPLRTVLRQVRMGLAEDAPVQSILLEDGRIAALLAADAELPPGARVVEGEGLLALPAFLDAFTSTGCVTPAPVAERDVPVPYDAGPRIDMRAANRKGLQPAFQAVAALDFSQDKLKAWRQSGFGALLCAPSGELLAGKSALVTTRVAAARDLVLAPDVLAHAALRASGPGYPSTTMAYLAHLRQFFMDARHLADLEERFAAGRPGPRPPFDADLDAALPILAGTQRLACEANRADDIERWIRLADQFGLQIEIVGGGQAWRLADVLAERKIPVVLTLDWGEEAEDPHADEKKQDADKAQEKGEPEGEAETATAGAEPAPEAAAAGEPQAKAEPEVDPNVYEEPLALREERRRLWLERRDCALRLAEAGVPFTFGSADGNASELLKNVRSLVEAGLDESVALAALTSNAAGQLGAQGHLGTLDVGGDATLGLWTASPFGKEAKLAWLFVDGFEHEFKLDQEAEDTTPPDEGVDASGDWTLTFKGRGSDRKGTASLSMEKDGTVKGTLAMESRDGTLESTVVEGRVSGSTLRVKGTLGSGDREISIRLEATLTQDSLAGDSTSKAAFGEFTRTVTGTRTPKETR